MIIDDRGLLGRRCILGYSRGFRVCCDAGRLFVRGFFCWSDIFLSHFFF